MSSVEIQKIGVIGAGQMGNGIAHVSALAGYEVSLSDISDEAIEGGLATIRGNLARMVKKEKISQSDADAALARITTGVGLEVHSQADLVVEAATENPEIKFQIFRAIDQIVGENCILASNTSSISITAIAAQTSRPHRSLACIS